MKASNIIIFVLVIIAIVAIVGYAVWKVDTNTEDGNVQNIQPNENVLTENEVAGNLLITEPSANQESTNTIDENNNNVQLQNYV